MNFVLAVTVLIKEIRTILGIKADNVEMWSLEENKEIKENELEIEINQLEENKEIEATNLEKKSKKDNNNNNNNIRIDLNLMVYISAPIKTCIVLAFLGKNYDKITTEMLSWIIVLSIVTLISSLGAIKYALKMKGQNKWKEFLQRYKYNDQDDNHEQHKRNNYVWIFFGLFFTLVYFIRILLYIEIAFWFDLNSYLSKLLWNVLALDTTITKRLAYKTNPIC
ncbi:6352_t:CDS:2 [Entrophospora sp. SA101]|nr:6352_t:CDS:2 [Entrophospora sp. SA101]